MRVDEERPGPAPPGSGADDPAARARCRTPAAWRGALRRAGGQASVLRERAAWTRTLGAGRIRLVPADPSWPDDGPENDAAPATGGNRRAGDLVGTAARPSPYSARGPVRAGEEAPSRPYPRPGRGAGAAARRRTAAPDPAETAPRRGGAPDRAEAAARPSDAPGREGAARRRGGAPGPAEGQGAASVLRQSAACDTATDTGGPGQALRQADPAPAPDAGAALPTDQGARPWLPLGHRPESPETPHPTQVPGRGVTRAGRRDGLAGRALAALTPQSDAGRGRNGAGSAGLRVAAMRRSAPSDAGAWDDAGREVPGDATNTRAVAATYPSRTAPGHQGGAAPAPSPDPFATDWAWSGTAVSLPATGGHVRHVSGQAAATRRPEARPEPEPAGEPVPDDTPREPRQPLDLSDLADQLNRILCDEARRHGIDV